MNKLSVPYRGKAYYYQWADNWDGLPYKHLAWITSHLQEWKNLYHRWLLAKTNGSPAEAIKLDARLQKVRISILVKLTGLPRWPWSKRKRAFFSLYPDEVADCLKTLNFIFTDMDRGKPPVPFFRHKGRCYFSPGENFENMTGEDFHFSALLLEKDPYQVLAINYRPQGKGPRHNPKSRHFCGDIREPLNLAKIEEDALILRKLPKGMLNAFLFWYHCYRLKLQEANPDIFSKPNAAKAQAGDGWIPIFRALSDKPLHFDEAAKMNMSRLLMELRYRKQEQKEQERRLAKAKNKR